MTLVRRLYVQFQHLIHEGAKFLVVGGVGLIVTNLVYSLMRHYGIGPVTATTVATIVATVVTYVGNRYWSFRHRERAGVAREGTLFLVLNGVGLLIQDAVVAFGAYVLGFQHGHKLQQLIMLNIGIAIATLFRFWSYRKWVWVAPAGDTAAAVVAVPAGSPAPGGTTLAGSNGHPRNGGGHTGTNGHSGASGRASGNGHAAKNGHLNGHEHPVARRR